MATMLSGIKPTGHAHLGNYLGALQHWVAGQHEDDCLYAIVDLHALTVPHDPKELQNLTVELFRVLLAIGLDPEVCVLFLQSQVHEHAELAWVMECTVSMGELRRMTQFKEKSGGQEAVRAGLFTYPALMAADILLYNADRVPVGDDQRQHLELTRDLAIRFNTNFGETFVVPEAAIVKTGARIMDLQDPTGKMGKTSESTQGTIYLLDDLSDVERKIKRAVTDTETEVRFDPETKPGISNLLAMLAAATGGSPVELAKQYKQYGALKTDTAEAVVELLRPIQQRYQALTTDETATAALMSKGRDKAQAIAAATMDRVRDAIGLPR